MLWCRRGAGAGNGNKGGGAVMEKCHEAMGFEHHISQLHITCAVNGNKRGGAVQRKACSILAVLCRTAAGEPPARALPQVLKQC